MDFLVHKSSEMMTWHSSASTGQQNATYTARALLGRRPNEIPLSCQVPSRNLCYTFVTRSRSSRLPTLQTPSPIHVLSSFRKVAFLQFLQFRTAVH